MPRTGTIVAAMYRQASWKATLTSSGDAKKEKRNMLWTILVVLVVLWLLGFGLSFGGNLIHLLLLVALVVLVINLITGRRSV